jgi:hypothetical protein
MECVLAHPRMIELFGSQQAYKKRRVWIVSARMV